MVFHFSEGSLSDSRKPFRGLFPCLPLFLLLSDVQVLPHSAAISAAVKDGQSTAYLKPFCGSFPRLLVDDGFSFIGAAADFFNAGAKS